jgi:hypothetical protein
MLDSVLASIEAQTKDQASVAADHARKHDILSELAPPLWAKFRHTLKVECEKRPKYFMFMVGADTIVACKINHRALEVEYSPASKTIAFRIMDKEADDFIGRYSIRLDENDLAAIYDADRKILVSISSVVDKLLTLLVS